MLRGLDISDMLIIDRLELEFQPGLNVLTGETGAGKSILLDSLGFVLGWRGRADLVRQGAEQGEVTAWFDLPAGHPARPILEEAGFTVEDELILRRVNTRDGRKTAWINDRRASGEVLRRVSETLVELHGQHDDRGLLNPTGHRAILDTFGALDGERAAVRQAWRARAEAAKALEAARAKVAAAEAEQDFVRHAVAEMDKLDPQPGEEESLDVARRTMQGAEKVREDVSRAYAVLSEGAEGAMGDGLRWLEGASDALDGQLDGALAALSRAMTELGEATDGVMRVLDALDFDPGELERTEERLFALRALARKHGVPADDLARLAEEMRGKLADIDGGAERLAGLEAEMARAEQAYGTAARALTAARQASALRLDREMAAELAPLKMERARFETVVEPTEPGPEGRDAVTFTVATNPGAPAGALNKIASGGELSRFLLALKVCLAGEDVSGLTMIFDEIDRGVGGATADAVGRRLAALAASGQVLVVTHSPQVAALGQHHWQVAKRVVDDMTLSSVTPLAAEARVDEVARMLAGDAITEEARAAARRLIDAG